MKTGMPGALVGGPVSRKRLEEKKKMTLPSVQQSILRAVWMGLSVGSLFAPSLRAETAAPDAAQAGAPTAQPLATSPSPTLPATSSPSTVSTPTAGAGSEEALPPAIHRLSVRLGGGGWQHNFGLVTLTGISGGGGFLFERIRGPIRYLAGLEGMRVMQSVGGESLESSVGGGTGVGARDAVVGMLTVGAGYQWADAPLKPLITGRAGVAAGYDHTWVDLTVHTETTTIATNVFWGYDLTQVVAHSGPLVSPVFDVGFGIEPFKGAKAARLHLVPMLELTYLTRNKTFALALNLQLGFP